MRLSTESLRPRCRPIIIERAVALTDGEEITPQDLPKDLQKLEFDTLEGEGLLSLEEMERRYPETTLVTVFLYEGRFF